MVSRYLLFVFCVLLTQTAVSQEVTTVAYNRSTGGAAHRVPAKRLHARVYNESFERLADARGIWKGLIQGNGTIHLRLNILNNGVIQSSRYMGCVQQHDWEKPTPFKFISALPRGRHWTWQIVAKAKSL